ncbi:hypothetical protein CXG81DRAFT_50, partial [Caulochytrium protostelioides]
MAVTKKNAKGRLDKYYYLAKEQGYRARSAFKLIQLNRRYGFLEKSKCLIDLCAAPGGWCQVAAKYMPKPSVIVGVDLCPIKPIPNVVALQEDIRTVDCYNAIKREIKDWKVDVVLHDGAPNVGTAWTQDAFSQSELTLCALKLATQFLAPDGVFVTKVFRSKDYNKLMWVFGKLFGSVQATKPASSRNVSAEIFVVCEKYLAPKKIDPRLLNPRTVFGEEDAIEEDEQAERKDTRNAQINDIFNPTKHRRQREGYAEDNVTLHTQTPVSKFILSRDSVGVLGRSNELTFTTEEEILMRDHPMTSSEIPILCKDLKLLNKRDFRILIKWRAKIRKVFLPELDDENRNVEEANHEKGENADADAEAGDGSDGSEDIETELANAAADAAAVNRRRIRRERLRRAKTLLRLRLNMGVHADLARDAAEGEEANQLAATSIGLSKRDARDGPALAGPAGAKPIHVGDLLYGSDDDAADDAMRLAELEGDMDAQYEVYRQRQLERDAKALLRKEMQSDKKNRAAMEMDDAESPDGKFEDWYGGLTDDSDAEEDAGNETDDSDLADQVADSLSVSAQRFFSDPLFDSLAVEDPAKAKAKKAKQAAKKAESAFAMDGEDQMAFDKQNAGMEITLASDADMSDADSVAEEAEDDIEIVPKAAAAAAAALGSSHGGAAGADTPREIRNYAITTAEQYTMAQRVIRPSGRRDLMDGAFNRFMHVDTAGIPEWFLDDERKHNQPGLPVTKQAIKAIRERLKELDARPIKKVAEAKFRKQIRSQKRLAKAAKKAAAVHEDDADDLGDKAKLKAAAKVMGKARAAISKQQRNKVQVVVAKGGGANGRPKGVKGRYKMVDARLKKDMRAQKR